ncbi:MAG: hypothetical protein AB7P34_05880 [Vicinamibacterales bacterium]
MNTQPYGSNSAPSEDGTTLQWRVRGEYLEMPGLRLSLDQAARMWAVDRESCGTVLDALVSARFLQRDQDGRYMRRSGGY